MSRPHLVVIGASLAGLRAVEAARRTGFDGRLTLVGAENTAPYDRPPLSKSFLTDENPTPPTLRSAESLVGDLAVELRLGRPATALDARGRRVLLGGNWLDFDGLVITTGARARRLPSLERLAGVHRLRTLDDARALRSALRTGARVLVVGAGFIGSEVAASARALGCQVTIVEALSSPLIRAVGEEVGRRLARLHLEHGVDLRCGTKIETIEGAGRVERVLLSDGTAVDCDVVVLGTGAEPVTDWLRSSGLELADGVVCRPDLSTAVPGVYAAGDVARWPNEIFDDRPMRLEHWTSAAEQASHAVRAWLGGPGGRAFTTVPYFWSDWYGSRIQFVGVSAAEGTLTVPGSADHGKWLVLYRRGDRLVGVLAVNSPSLIMKFRALITRKASWAEAIAFAHAGM